MTSLRPAAFQQEDFDLESGPRALLDEVVGVHFPGEHPLYSAVFYARARLFCIKCDGEYALVPDWMAEQAREPSQAQIAREIGVREHTVSVILAEVRQAAPDEEAIVRMAAERWTRAGGVRVCWTSRLRDVRGLKPLTRLVHAFLARELSGEKPRPSWTDQQIARRLGCAAREVARKVKRLCEAGLISVERGRPGRASRYAIKPFAEAESGSNATLRYTNAFPSRMTEQVRSHDETGRQEMTEQASSHGETGSHPEIPRPVPRFDPENAASAARRFSLDLFDEIADAKRVPDGLNQRPVRRRARW